MTWSNLRFKRVCQAAVGRTDGRDSVWIKGNSLGWLSDRQQCEGTSGQSGEKLLDSRYRLKRNWMKNVSEQAGRAVQKGKIFPENATLRHNQTKISYL